MLVFTYLKSIQPVTITVKKSTGGFLFDYATYWVLTVKVVTHTQYYSIYYSSTHYYSSIHLYRPI